MHSVLVFIVGLSVGSFINVFLARYGKKESAFRGRSKCPHCSHKLAWFELIPLASFFWLGGRCRHCRAKISNQYPAVELISGLGFLLLYLNLASLSVFLLSAAIFVVALVMSAYDIKNLVIPDSFLAVLFLLVLLGNILFWRDTIVINIVSGFILASFFLVLFLVSWGRWIGGGDIKLGAIIGFWLGWPALTVMFITTYVLGAVVSVGLLVARKAGRGSQIPFAPFMLVGSFVAFVWAADIISWYINIVL